MYLQNQRDQIVCLACVLGFGCVLQFANAQTTTRVSVSSAAIESNDISSRPAISADGRYIAFYSDADNLVAGDTPTFDAITCSDPLVCTGFRDIFVNDISTGNTVRVSVSSTGIAGNGKSDRPSVSSNGRFVAFTSDATNLVTGDNNGQKDIFVHDRDVDMDGIFDEAGAISTVRASLAFDQAEADGRNNIPFISADGRFVAFRSRATNLVSGGTASIDHIYVRDLQTNSTVLVSKSTAGVEGNNTSDRPYLTPDGRFVSYFSDADNLVAGDLQTNDPIDCPTCPGFRDAFVHDRDPDQNGVFDEGNGTTERVSISSGSVAGNGHSTRPSMSSDGRYVQFKSSANNLVAGDTNNADDIFIRDRQMGTTVRVSVSTAGAQLNGAGPNSSRASVSFDGRYVAFVSKADDLVAGDNNSSKDVFIRDRTNSNTFRISVDVSGVEGNGRSDRPHISGSGRFVSFYSDADNLIPNDDPAFDATLCPDCPGVRDVFVYDRDPDTNDIFDEGNQTIERVSINTAGDPANGLSSESWITSDGRFVVFRSKADNLVLNDTNLADDIFVRDRLLNTTTRVNLHTSGAQSSGGDSEFASISDDGRYVAFRSKATNLVDGDTNGMYDVFLRDRLTDITTRVSISSAGDAADGKSDRPWISADGRYVGFISEATNLVSGDTNGNTDVFVRNLQTNTTVRVSVDSSGNQGNAGSDRVTLSDDGRFVAIRSKADNLIIGDDPSFDANKCPTCIGERDVFVRDRDADVDGIYDESNAVTTTRVSVSSGGIAGDRETGGPKISGDGLVVAMVGAASNLVAGDTNYSEDVFAHVRASGVTERVSVSSTESQASSPIKSVPDSDDVAMSGDARFIAFRSDAVNLSDRDRNNVADIFLHDRDTDEDGIFDETGAIETRRINLSTFGVEANLPSGGTEISADGSHVTYYSDATTLFSQDNNGVRDVFLYSNPSCSADSDCDDGVNCTSDTCNLVTNSCEHLPNHAFCNNSLFCDGEETCNINLGCQTGTPVVCDDGVACTNDLCNETTDSCDAFADDSLCSNGLFCDGDETCDPILDCQSGADPCPHINLTCDESADVCLGCSNDSECDDGIFCDGLETCSGGTCLAGTPPCNDGVSCTIDSCDEGLQSCSYLPHDALCNDTLFCNGVETCHATLDCQAGMAPNCDDAIICTTDSCDESANTCDHSPIHTSCDNAVFCDGLETCSVALGCQSGTIPSCSDGVGCTEDFCNTNTDTCGHLPNDSFCDNNLFCDGVETCHATLDCQAGANPCPGQGCDESGDVCTDIVCLTPEVVASGCRYIDVTPAAGVDPIALLVKGNAGDPNVSCISLYVQADGVLGVTPVYQTPEAWGVVHAYGSEVYPSSTYDIQADCGNTPGDVVSSVVSATTWKWGDTNNSLSSDISDILRVVDGFLGLFVRRAFPCTSDADCQDLINTPFFECDLVEGFCVSGTIQSLDFIDFPAIETNCLPNRIVDIVDILASVDAWLGDVFPCSSVCP